MYLTTNTKQHTQQQYKQLISKKITTNINNLLTNLKKHNHQNSSQTHTPLKPTKNTLQLNNSKLNIKQSIQQILN